MATFLVPLSGKEFEKSTGESCFTEVKGESRLMLLHSMRIKAAISFPFLLINGNDFQDFIPNLDLLFIYLSNIRYIFWCQCSMNEHFFISLFFILGDKFNYILNKNVGYNVIL